MRKHFISFGDSVKFPKSIRRIEQEANNTNCFDNVKVFRETDISDFIERHSDFFLNNKKGFGYYMWKPYIIYEYLLSVDDGDIVMYADSGCTFNINTNSMKRLAEYFSLLNDSVYDTISFATGHNERDWTKKEMLKYFNAENDNSKQIMATVLLVKKSEKSLEMFKEIVDLFDDGKYFLFDGSLNEIQFTNFRDHRWDQSVLSLLRKRYGTLMMPPEPDMYSNNHPIHAKRIRE